MRFKASSVMFADEGEDVNERNYTIAGPADPNFSRVARLAISAIASESQANIEEVDDVRLVISEVINIALDSKANSIEVSITTNFRSLAFKVTAFDVDQRVSNDLSMRIFDALVKNFSSEMESQRLTMSGDMVFSE